MSVWTPARAPNFSRLGYRYQVISWLNSRLMPYLSPSRSDGSTDAIEDELVASAGLHPAGGLVT
jgi:hypothetical protein